MIHRLPVLRVHYAAARKSQAGSSRVSNIAKVVKYKFDSKGEASVNTQYF